MRHFVTDSFIRSQKIKTSYHFFGSDKLFYASSVRLTRVTRDTAIVVEPAGVVVAVVVLVISGSLGAVLVVALVVEEMESSISLQS